MQTHLISYDISDDRLRTKAAKLILRAGGHRIQYSVFMGTFSTARRQRLEVDLLALAGMPAWSDR